MHISSTATSGGGRETARTDLAGNCLRYRYQKFPVSVFRVEGTGQHNFFLLVQGPVATGNDQVCFVFMEKEGSNYAFPAHAGCAPCTFTSNVCCSPLCEIA